MLHIANTHTLQGVQLFLDTQARRMFQLLSLGRIITTASASGLLPRTIGSFNSLPRQLWHVLILYWCKSLHTKKKKLLISFRCLNTCIYAIIWAAASSCRNGKKNVNHKWQQQLGREAVSPPFYGPALGLWVQRQE